MSTFRTRMPKLLRPISGAGPQEAHVRRLITALVGVVAGVVTPYLVSVTGATVGATGQPGYWGLLALLLPPAILTGILGEVARRTHSRTADRWALRGLLTTLAIFMLVAIAATVAPIIPFHDQVHTNSPQPNLLVNDSIVITIACAAALRPRAALAFILAVIPLLIGTYPDTTAPGSRIEEVLVYQTGNLGNLGVLVWLLLQAKDLDAASAQHATQLVSLRAQESRTRSRQESNNFIHDHILSVLKVIPTLPADSPDLRISAHQALDSLMRSGRATPPRRPSEVASALRAMTSALADSPVCVREFIDTDNPLPQKAAQALTDAAAEALRNSLTHAGSSSSSPVTRTVSIEATSAEVVITIADDGRGFNPKALPAGHFGIPDSIRAAMEHAGGHATIRSASGAGTTVRLSYPIFATANAHPTTGGGEQDRPASPLTLISCMEHRLVRTVTMAICVPYLFVVHNEIRAGAYRNGLPVLAALGMDVATAVLLLWSWPGHRLPRWSAGTAVVMAASAHVITMSQIALTGYPGYAAWSIGVSTYLACGLLVRSRPGFSWTLLSLTTAATTAWTILTGHSPWVAVSISSGHITTLAIWHVMVRLSLSLTARTAQAQTASADIIARQHAQEIRRETMRTLMSSVRTRVTPILTPIANGAPLTPDLRTQAHLLEAELRDERRAPTFTGTPVTTAARAARQRGITVTLLDDHNPTPLDAQAHQTAIEQATAALQTATAGRILIRILPPHRHPDLMTITTDNATHTTDPHIHTIRV